MAHRVRFEIVAEGKNGYKLFDHPCLVLHALPFIGVCTENEKMVSVYVDLDPMRYEAIYNVDRKAGFIYYTFDKFTGEEESKTYIKKITVMVKSLNNASRFVYEIEIEGGFFSRASAVTRTMKTMLAFEKPRIRTYLSRTIKSLEETSTTHKEAEEAPPKKLEKPVAGKPVESVEKPVETGVSVEKHGEETEIDRAVRGETGSGKYRYDLCDPLIRYKVMKAGKIVATIKSRTNRVVPEIKSYSSRGGVYYVSVTAKDETGKKRMYLLVELGEVLGFCNDGVDVGKDTECTAIIYEVNKGKLKQIT